MLNIFAKNLRKNSTDAEQRLWYFLRSRRFSGYKFRRQHIIHPYIVDFVCLRKKLIIELEGGQHTKIEKEDAVRSDFLKLKGFEIIRFWNNDIFLSLENILEVILNVLEGRSSPSS